MPKVRGPMATKILVCVLMPIAETPYAGKLTAECFDQAHDLKAPAANHSGKFFNMFDGFSLRYVIRGR